MLSKYSFNLVKNSPTISKFSLETLPNTSSNTQIFSLGSEEKRVSTALSPRDDTVFSNPEPDDKSFLI